MTETGFEFVVTVYGLPRVVQGALFHGAERPELEKAIESVGKDIRGKDLGHTLMDTQIGTIGMFLWRKFAKEIATLENFDIAFKPETVSFTGRPKEL